MIARWALLHTAVAYRTFHVGPALGSKGQSDVRVTVVEDGNVPDANWDYVGGIKGADPAWLARTMGTKCSETGNVDVGGYSLPVRRAPAFPKSRGVRAIVMGDACYTRGNNDWCRGYHNGFYKIAGVLNAAMSHGDQSADILLMLGDNWYDRAGADTQEFYNQLSLDAQGLPTIVIPGNHDFWAGGSPDNWVANDMYGFPEAQYYGQDTLAALLDDTPGAFISAKDDIGVAHWKNFFHYSVHNNLGVIAFSGAHTWEQQAAAFQHACEFMVEENPAALFVIGHWPDYSFGSRLSTPDAFRNIRSGACQPLADRMRYGMGHVHENYKVEDGMGYILGAMGMKGNSRDYWGFNVLDTTGGQYKMIYFEMGDRNSDRSADIIGCLQSAPIQECYGLGNVIDSFVLPSV